MSNEQNEIQQDEQIETSAHDQAPAQEPAVDNAAAENGEAQSSEPAQEAEVKDEAQQEPQSVPEKTNDVATQPEADKQAKKETQKPQKPQKAGGKTREQKAKLFRLVYYPVLALFVALMLIFSALDGVTGYSPKAYGDGYYTAVNTHIKNLSGVRSAMAQGGDDSGVDNARDYIVSALVNGGFTEVDEVKEERDELSDELERQNTITGWAKSGETKHPTVTVQTSTLDADLQSELGLTEHLVGAEVSNIVAALPSSKANAGAVVITVRYDSRTDSASAASAAFVSNAVQSLIEMNKSGKKFANDVVVVFTEDLDYSYGAYAFFNLFDGLDDVVSRATVGVNLEAYGNSGTLALTDASNAGLDYIYAYTKVAGTALNSAAVASSIPSELINRDAVKAFGNIPAVQVSVLGGLDAAQSSLDSASEVSNAIIKQQARFISDYMEKFGDSTDKYSAKGDGKTAFFSYLDGGTVAYTAVAAYVVGALILALAAAVVIVSVFKKTFSLKNMFIALGVQLLAVISTLAALLAAYFVVTLMLTGFGVLPINAIITLRYSNAGIIIAAMLITLAASFGFTTLYKRLFRITSSDAVRGTALLFGLAGAVMSFACPAYSYMTAWLGFTLLAVLLTSICLHKAFKAKFGFGMDRLYLYAIPVALCLPLFMPELIALTQMLPLVLMPVLFTVFTAAIGVGVPYLDRTQPLLDKVAKKLPSRTIRVERTVTEKVEDRAKKGKFTEKTFKRVEKEKIALNYKNYFGISVVAVLGIVIALFSGGFGVSFNKSLTGYHSYNNAIYNDSIVYELDGDSQKIVVGDLMAYKYMRYHITDLKWDGTRYSKSVSYNINEIIGREPSLEKEDNVYTVTTFDGAHSNVTITIPSANSITRITLKEAARTDGDYEGYVYEYENDDEIVLRLPYGFDTVFTLEIEGGKPSQIKYEEHRTVAEGDSVLDIVDEWNSVRNVADMQGVRAGIVIKRTLSV